MTVISVDRPTVVRPLERGRGKWGMAMFILTEAALFAELFFAYFYLGTSHRPWPPERPPILLAAVLTVLLLLSSVTVYGADRAIKHGRTTSAIAGLLATLALGFSFVGVQIFEYISHLRTLKPTEGPYGSIFYTLTSFHGAHVLVGLLLVGFAVSGVIRGKFTSGHSQAVTNVTWYWHFVDVVWIALFLTLYLSPRIYL